MTACTLLLLVTLAAADHEQVIDAFAYSDVAAARRAWSIEPGATKLDVTSDGRRTIMQFAVPFASQVSIPRVSLDRRVPLDLSIAGEFVLEAKIEDLAAAGYVNLYFHSVDGWYSSSAPLTKKGWQTLHFSKANFHTEGTPAGWDRVDSVRISVWRGQAKDSIVSIRGLAALWHDVAIVIPSAARAKAKELHGVVEMTKTVSGFLAKLGLGADAIDDTALCQGALKNRRVAILAYHPWLDDQCVAALGQFVAGGGKVLACYSLPPRLGELLGFGKGKYTRQATPGQFSEMRFDAADIPGLPKAVRQSSGNITAAEPVGHNARVIGRWFDRDGRPTGQPAMLLSDRGAFLSHVFLSDDAGGKQQLLAAVLGRLCPSVWPQMARAQQEETGQIGHVEGYDALESLVRASGNAKAIARMKDARAGMARSQELCKQEHYPEAIEAARKASEQAGEAYLAVQPSRTREGRAIWNHSGTGAYPGDWERTAKELASGGFNMVLPNMLWGGLAHYASDILPRSETFMKHGDQISQCVAGCKKHGIEVHVWKVNYNLSNAPKDFVAKLREQGRTQVSLKGEPLDWLCPSHPENFQLERDAMLEVARRYEVDGVHFDYIRYPDGSHCYCQGCRERFEAASGAKVVNWPADCSTRSGPRYDEYRRWRCRQVTRLVEAVSREAKKIRPGIKISAAVFSAYPNCREDVGQDWLAWVHAGHLDFLCPMDYNTSDVGFVNVVANQLKLVGGRIPVYPGIGAWILGTPDRVVGQMHLARQLGAAGFTVFDLNEGLARSLMPAMAAGAGSKPAVPTHRWILSGGQGRCVDGHILEVTGSGNDSNHWSSPMLEFTPGALYRFRMLARRTGGSGGAISGPSFANRDQSVLDDRWRPLGHVFRATDEKGNHVVRVGQWHAAGSVQFDDVRVTPVMPIYSRVGGIPLGEGESLAEGRYHFEGSFDHEGSNFHRTLFAANAHFNSNRWSFGGKAQVTYRFAVPGHRFLSGRAGFNVNYGQGTCQAEVSRDGQQWLPLATQQGQGSIEVELPAALLPAETVFLRLSPAALSEGFQVSRIDFHAALDGTVPEGRGRTLFADLPCHDAANMIEAVAFDEKPEAGEGALRLTVKNVQSKSATAVLATKLTWQGAPAALPIEQRIEVPAAGAATLVQPIPLVHPGANRLVLQLTMGRDVSLATEMTVFVPDYYRTDYGRRIDGVAGTTDVWWCDATHKVPRSRAVPAASSSAAELSAAKNDREAVQIVLRPKAPLAGLTAVASALVGPDQAVIPAENVKILRVYYHKVVHPTDATGVRDWWPDALPPLAKPIDLAAGQQQPLWVLVHVPTAAKAGDYRGTVSLQAQGWSAQVPLRLHVWGFALPEKNHLETAFGLSAGMVFRYHQLKTEADKRRVWDLYLQSFAEHRISPYDPTPLDRIRVKLLPDAKEPHAELDFTAFDREAARVFEKYHFTNFRLGLQAMGGGTFHERHEPKVGKYDESTPQYQAVFSSYIKQLESHLREKGWLSMAYTYWFDEPDPKDYAFVRNGMERIRRYAPGIQRMLTEEPCDDLNGAVDIWCPVSHNYAHDKAEKRRAAGERIWWYVCCGPKAPFCTLFIDHPATELRVWHWQTWQRNVVGTLVWETNYWTSSAAYPDKPQNPYEDPMGYVSGYSTPKGTKAFWGNGDGRFLYPPEAAAVPGHSGDAPVLEGPVSSIRWEMLREGVEDYEFLYLLRERIAKKAGSLGADQRKRLESLLEVPAEITTDMTTFTTDPAPLYARRAAIAQAIEQLGH